MYIYFCCDYTFHKEMVLDTYLQRILFRHACFHPQDLIHKIIKDAIETKK